MYLLRMYKSENYQHNRGDSSPRFIISCSAVQVHVIISSSFSLLSFSSYVLHEMLYTAVVQIEDSNPGL